MSRGGSLSNMTNKPSPQGKHFMAAHDFLEPLKLSDKEFCLWKERIAELLAQQEQKLNDR